MPDTPTPTLGEDRNLIFIYGTLLSILGTHTMQSAWVRGFMASQQGGFPTLIANPEEEVRGALVIVESDLLRALDLYEGVNHAEEGASFYVRRQVDVLIDDSSRFTHPAWVWMQWPHHWGGDDEQISEGGIKEIQEGLNYNTLCDEERLLRTFRELDRRIG